MNTQTMNGYTDKKLSNANAQKQLLIAKSLNRPVILLKRGVTGEMRHRKEPTISIGNLTMMQKADDARKEATKLFESGMPFSEIAKKLRKSRNTISNYFNHLVAEKGEDWGKRVKEKRG